jgi:type IV pilus assembly protein PilB
MPSDKRNAGPPAGFSEQSFRQVEFCLPTVDLDAYEIPGDVIDLVPREMCELYTVVPVQLTDESLVVAVADPTGQAALRALALHTRLEIEVVVSTAGAIVRAIAKHYRA